MILYSRKHEVTLIVTGVIASPLPLKTGWGGGGGGVKNVTVSSHWSTKSYNHRSHKIFSRYRYSLRKVDLNILNQPQGGWGEGVEELDELNHAPYPPVAICHNVHPTRAKGTREIVC